MTMFSLSTHLFVYYSLDPIVIRQISKSGFRYIEVWGTQPHFHYNDKNYLKMISRELYDNQIIVASFHSPFYMRLINKRPEGLFSISDCDESKRKRSVEEIRNFIEAINEVDFPLEPPVPVVLHTGFTGKNNLDCQNEALYLSIEFLIREVRGSRFIFALENGAGGLDNPDWVAEFVTGFSSPYLRMCLDIGHANITDPSWLKSLDGYLDMIVDFHIHDNYGKIDEHLPPGRGKIDFEKFFNVTGGARLFTVELMDYSRGEEKSGVEIPLEESVNFLKRRGLWKPFIRGSQ